MEVVIYFFGGELFSAVQSTISDDTGLNNRVQSIVSL